MLLERVKSVGYLDQCSHKLRLVDFKGNAFKHEPWWNGGADNKERFFYIYIYIHTYVFLKKVRVILPPAGHLPGRSYASHSTKWSEKLTKSFQARHQEPDRSISHWNRNNSRKKFLFCENCTFFNIQVSKGKLPIISNYNTTTCLSNEQEEVLESWEQSRTRMQLQIFSSLTFWIMIHWQSKLRNPFTWHNSSFPMTEQSWKKNITGWRCSCASSVHTHSKNGSSTTNSPTEWCLFSPSLKLINFLLP